MILADKIIDERKKCGWSQEELADKLGVSRQSVSKWESAQSVPDLQRILEMSKIFGVSTDYLLKDEEGVRVSTDTELEEACARRVSMEEANAYLDETEHFSRKISLGVFLCVASPIMLIGCLALQQAGILFSTENAASFAGVIALLAMVTAAVVIFIPAGMAHAKWDWLGKEVFETGYGVDGMVRSRKEKHQPSFVMNITIGVVMILAGVIAICVAGLIDSENDALVLGCTCLLLALVAIATQRFVRVGLVRGGFSVLLQENGHTKESKRRDALFDSLAGAYWLCVTAAFLLWGFLANDGWKLSWIVWPIGGVLFGAFAAIYEGLHKRD